MAWRARVQGQRVSCRGDRGTRGIPTRSRLSRPREKIVQLRPALRVLQGIGQAVEGAGEVVGERANGAAGRLDRERRNDEDVDDEADRGTR